MNKTVLEHMTFGEYLRRLRESRNISQRQAAKAAGISYAYLSQIEGSKRGTRKKGEDHFAPHPQFLKKLADVYHVSAGQLFERAGYLDDKQNIHGFSEEREVERIFDFVISDPALKKVFAVLDKRAIINRFESLTGKRLITWAGDPDKHPTVSKVEFAGLRFENGMLHAETSNTKLNLAEVAQELGCTEEDVKTIIKNNQLRAKPDDFNELFVEKNELQKFKNRAIHHWTHNNARIPIADGSASLDVTGSFAQLPDDESFPDEIEKASSKKKKSKSRK